MPGPLEDLRTAVADGADALRGGPGSGVTPTLERPKREEFGDVSTNAAMLLAPALRTKPRDIAEKLGEELAGRLGPELDRWEVAGPGFLNLFLADAWFARALRGVLDAGKGFGGGGAAAPERVLVEFVSANPTGPLTAASGRHAAFGDALARVLEFHGNVVTREFYVNDWGTQVIKLAESIRARRRGEPVPKDGYEGAYVAVLAEELDPSLELAALARAGVERNLEAIRATLSRFGVQFDAWFHESSLYADDAELIAETLRVLTPHVYESEGATWLRTTSFGDDKDRVLRRASGEPTYFLPDAAHHLWKLRQGYERLLDVFGADHHGYVARMRAAVAALGAPPDVLEILIMQFVHVVEGGARSSMSKRRGEFVTLDELLDDVGVDAARWFLVQRSHDTTLDLDLDLARSQSAENPVYYVQYAHARIASLRAKAERDGAAEPSPAPPATPLHAAERGLVSKLLAFPGEVGEAAERRAPHRVCAYALELAQEFTAFYRDCRVVGADARDVEAFRLALCTATQQTIASALGLLGVGAPESM